VWLRGPIRAEREQHAHTTFTVTSNLRGFLFFSGGFTTGEAKLGEKGATYCSWLVLLQPACARVGKLMES
jgi:hypothetical protein